MSRKCLVSICLVIGLVFSMFAQGVFASEDQAVSNIRIEMISGRPAVRFDPPKDLT